MTNQNSCSSTCSATMAGKPVLYRDAKTVLTFESHGFQEKGLCDGITLNPGDACVFRCTYCYVGGAMMKVVKPVLNSHAKTL